MLKNSVTCGLYICDKAWDSWVWIYFNLLYVALVQQWLRLCIIFGSARYLQGSFFKFCDPVKLVPPRVWYKIGSGCFSSECGSTCLRRFITPTARDTLFDIFLLWEFQLIFSLNVSPRKLNSSTLSLPISSILVLGISQSRNAFCLTCNNIYLVLEKIINF